MRIILLSLALLANPALAAASKTAPDGSRLCVGNRAIKATRLSPQGYFVKVDGRWYRNAMNGCPLLADDRIVSSLSPSERQCKGDQLQVSQPVTNLGFGTCTLAEWTPVADQDVPAT
jgi:hypothetical protein